ncbi:MAG: diguanylate cyclase [Alicyclobacillus sp.]|nr:diguanylate cyclase [Alicyclobacillus sp.]
MVFYTLSGLLVLAERSRIPIHAKADMTLEDVYLIGFSLAYPLYVVAWAGVAYALSTGIRYGKFWYTQVANAAGTVAVILFARSVYGLFSSAPSPSDPSWAASMLVFTLVFIVAHMAFFGLHLAVYVGMRDFRALWKETYPPQVLLVYCIEILLGVLLATVLHTAGLAGALLFTALVMLVAWSYRDYFKMARHFRALAITDELTGLHNHRYIHSKIDEWIEAKSEFALLMLDIDHFRRYNEIWGHVRGDDALRAVADILRANLLPGEEQARVSGEEFMVLLPNYDLAQAQLKAEVLRRAIESADFPGADQLPGRRMTVSIGVARFPEMARNKKELMVMVDEALYKGKFTGRNKVSLFESVLDEMKRDFALDHDDQEIIKTIQVFLAILNSKDRYTYAHTERDVVYASALAERVGLSAERLRYLRFGAYLHDIGKVEVPIEVLAKRGPLTHHEWQIMRSHVEIGENIAKPIPSLGPCLPIIRHHHERYDGTGYPDGLKGDDIPLEARILTIADSFDAMTTSRPYQRKRSMEEAFIELRRCAGSQFDPNLVEPFIEVVEEIGLLTESHEEDLA